MYNSCQNIFLSIAFAWILFSITDDSQQSKETNSKSLFTRLMGCKPFCLLGKLTLTGYLVLPLIHTVFLSMQQQNLYTSLILLVSTSLFWNFQFMLLHPTVLRCTWQHNLYVFPGIFAVSPCGDTDKQNHQTCSENSVYNVDQTKQRC